MEKEKSPDLEVYSVLPTTPELAREGVLSFEKVVNALSEARLRWPFISQMHTSARRVFTGVSAESVFQTLESNESDTSVGLTRSELEAIAATIADVTPDIVLHFRSLPGERHLIGEYFLLSLPSAARVISQHQNYFPPDARDNPKEWLLQKPELWEENPTHEEGKILSDIRYGLLSGYPVWSVEMFQEYRTAQKYLRQILFPKEERELLESYLRDPVHQHKDKMKVAAILLETGLPSRQQQALLNGRLIYSSTGIVFRSFDEIKDNVYLHELEAIFSESGITKTAKKYR